MLYPALDVANVDGELVLAAADDYSPTAVEERDGRLTLFFADRARRDQAHAAIAGRWPQAVTTPREVDDEGWARRPQQNLEPVTVGRITLFPNPQSLIRGPSRIAIVIEPSTGFGTGHHATTRLCLEALQAIDLAGTFVLDIGTGSGVLAIAARHLGARGALGIDNDPDAVQAARANLQANPGVDEVAFVEADLASWLGAPTPGPRPFQPHPDIVTANLTGDALVRAVEWLAASMVSGGSLIVSGLLAAERDEVVAAFASTGRLRVAREREEDGWVGLTFRSQV